MGRNNLGRKGYRSTTLRDVAASVGVSESTASVVLNKTRSGTRVSATTRRSILEAAHRLGYRPNALARSLQSGRTHRIGFYSSRMQLAAGSNFISDLLGGVLEGCTGQGLNLLLHTAGSDREQLLDLLSSQSVDGLLIHARDDDPIVQMLDELRVPCVALADQIIGIPSVCVDDAQGGLFQAQHLATLGHRHVLYKCAPPCYSVTARFESFMETSERLGMKVTVHPCAWVQEFPDEQDLKVLSAPKDRATAYVLSTDGFAELAVISLTKLGIRIPADVAVVGFDGNSQHHMNLTTVHASWSQVGVMAVNQLTRLLTNEDVNPLTRVPVQFVRGETT